jgi:hypothetical protein
VPGLFVFQVEIKGAAGAVTVKTRAVDVIPERLAVMLLVPMSSPVARPEEFMVATAVLAESQVTVDVISGVEASV